VYDIRPLAAIEPDRVGQAGGAAFGDPAAVVTVTGGALPAEDGGAARRWCRAPASAPERQDILGGAARLRL